MDWDPSAPAVVRSVQPAAAPATVGEKKATPARSRAASKPAPASGPAPQTPDTADDPWARAVEEAPGIWAVGTDSNIGSHRPDEPVAPEPTPEPEPPHYEPAAAQVPHYAAAVSASAAYEPVETSSNGWGDSVELVPAGAAVASASASASLATAAHSPITAPAPPAEPTTTGRQSLYQRLSNSPEAEAGRAKAPARAAAATATYVQDIPSADDETIEESGVFGRAAVERILGGKLVEERSLDGSPLPPRF